MSAEVYEYKGIPTMIPPKVHKYLEVVGGAWTGKGIALEVGSWLGGSAAALLTGLVEARYDRAFYCIDYWKADESQIQKAEAKDVKLEINQNTLPMFMDNVHPIYRNLHPMKGTASVKLQSYPGDPIEICLLDAPKRDPEFMNVMKTVMTFAIPGVTVLGLMDYYFYKRKEKGSPVEDYVKAPVRFIEKNQDHFEKMKEWENAECVFFKVKSIPINYAVDNS
jgi:hypothetical protein